MKIRRKYREKRNNPLQKTNVIFLNTRLYHINHLAPSKQCVQKVLSSKKSIPIFLGGGVPLYQKWPFLHHSRDFPAFASKISKYLLP